MVWLSIHLQLLSHSGTFLVFRGSSQKRSAKPTRCSVLCRVPNNKRIKRLQLRGQQIHTDCEVNFIKARKSSMKSVAARGSVSGFGNNAPVQGARHFICWHLLTKRFQCLVWRCRVTSFLLYLSPVWVDNFIQLPRRNKGSVVPLLCTGKWLTGDRSPRSWVHQGVCG